MALFTEYDEKAAYEHHCQSRRGHSKSSSNTSNLSSSSSSSSSSSDLSDEKSDPPAYASVFYNSFDQKPLPKLPTGERTVRFMVEKPLPPLPSDRRVLKRRESHEGGEYAWFSQGGRRGVEGSEEWDEKMEL